MRIVALSDQHGYLPEIPPCDLLLVAGDVCPDVIGGQLARDRPDRQRAWFDDHARSWLAQAPATHKILTWGNHDFCGQACNFDRDAPSAAPSTTLQIVLDCATRVPAGAAAAGSISIWATPWSHEFGSWAFMKSRAELADLYQSIPAGTDVLVSHEPPFGHGDAYDDCATGTVLHLGSRELLAAIERVRPRLVICGHFHGGYGCFSHAGATIYNVSVVDEHYQMVRPPTVIDVTDW